jgi:hypothetical protein
MGSLGHGRPGASEASVADEHAVRACKVFLVTTISSAASDRQRPDDVSVVGKHSDHTGHRMSNAENRMVGMDFLALGQGGKAPP